MSMSAGRREARISTGPFDQTFSCEKLEDGVLVERTKGTEPEARRDAREWVDAGIVQP